MVIKEKKRNNKTIVQVEHIVMKGKCVMLQYHTVTLYVSEITVEASNKAYK